MAVSTGFAFDMPFSACGDLSSYQYRFVAPATTAKRVQLASGASAPGPMGVLQNDPADGQECAVRILGSTKLYADAGTAIVYGDFLTAGSAGQGVIAAGSAFHAMSMTTLASGSGVQIEALLIPHGAFLTNNTP